MKITIDTKHDSKEEIEKAIALLKNLMVEQGATQDYSPMFGNIFGSDDSGAEKEPDSSEDSATDSSASSIFGLFQDDNSSSDDTKGAAEREEKQTDYSDDMPRIMTY